VRYGGSNEFDVSDVPDGELPVIDSIDGILDVAREVLGDYGGVHGNTRIERMARWLAANIGAPPFTTERPADNMVRYRIHENAHNLVRVGGIYTVEEQKTGIQTALAVGSDGAHSFAIALLRAVEEAG
jgi:hypothetical protein